LLITEKGLEREKKVSKVEIGAKGSALRSSAIKPINSDHINYKPYFHMPISTEHKAKAIAENYLKKHGHKGRKMTQS
jgi:hypothetical protein